MGEATAAEFNAQAASSTSISAGLWSGSAQQMQAPAAKIERAPTKHDDTTRILHALMAQSKIGEPGVADKPPPADEEPDPGEVLNSGTSYLFHTKAKWTANTAGASSSAGATEAERGSEGSLAGGGGGGTGGAGGVRIDAAPKAPLKMGPGDLWKDRQLREYRRANGECFKCELKYDPTHVCGQKKAATLIAMDTEDGAVLSAEEVLNMLEMQDMAEAQRLSLSIHAMAGSEGAETLRLRALVGNQVFIILVDSGSSGLFIHSQLLEKANCTVKEAPTVAVKVANGEYMHSTQIVPDFTGWSNGATFVTPMRVLDLGAYDAILGIDWLKKHSPMTTDWNGKFLSFHYNGKQVTLQGLQESTTTSVREVTVEQVAKWSKGNGIWALAVVQVDGSVHAIATDAMPAEIQQLVEQFQVVFSEPVELPPARDYDHAIPLKADAPPVNARPYWYSLAHKDEIERQVTEMLKAGLIVRNMSPFASPVLLVKKKDGSWRFCVDYRRLNELTIKNIFPMPIIDELLDELAGAKIFSKLDLRAGYHQIRMLPEDEMKTAFKTHQGHYQFRVMPFGLCNASATFQCVMNSVLQPCLRRSVLVFMDDILVYR
ncbi:hypothetical protein QYE76_018497 [Lolium multiflorum]|uniref:Reverse transcriptase domain-containing protein n=1 Tax=Lolium multiflorum TaxID=4521 RepID=A0AAD8VEG9_LOLMU|nr:hypothetical protein QYE76_018497 [Lolium multiflorum]